MSKHSLLTRDVWCVLGLPFDDIDLSSAVNRIESNISQQEACFLSTPNLNFVITTQTEPEFFQSVVDSDLSVADGMPLIWVSKFLGIPLTERVAGSTLFDELSKYQIKMEKIKIFFFGGQVGIAEQAHQQLNKTSTAMQSCGFYDPGFVSVDDMSTPNIIDHINVAAPDFIIVALGAKKGQQWIQQNRNKLTAPVISHLGAVINFVAGNVIRAPLFWQRCGLEWLWRIKQEPALWKRYLFDGLNFIKLLSVNVFPLAIYDRILRRTASFKEICHIEIAKEDKIFITLTGSVYHQKLEPVKQCFVQVIEKHQGDVIMNCVDLKYVDSAFIATLLLFQRYLVEQGRSLALSNVPKCIINILRLSSALKRFTLLSSQS
ncbi:MAG: hypothetical protein COB23_09550 [Methylophaga sp.]|nr:MAG: hypothetical protein COB23_09550 [Methylophaga sp.]